MKILSLHIVLLAPSVILAQSHQVTREMNALADAERAFAAASIEDGIRASFLRFFAEDGIAFQPGPVVYKDAIRTRPAPANPRAFTLDWSPEFGDVALSGDLGYTTGPYVLTNNTVDAGTPSNGYYFSVWKKADDGAWKVALDIGIPTPSPGRRKEFAQASSPHFPRPADGRSPQEELLEAERRFALLTTAEGFSSGVERFFHAESRLHRSGILPLVGKSAILSSVAADTLPTGFNVDFAATAGSGNFGYTYGRFEQADTLAGYFARVWKMDNAGEWRIVADITSPLQP